MWTIVDRFVASPLEGTRMHHLALEQPCGLYLRDVRLLAHARGHDDLVEELRLRILKVYAPRFPVLVTTDELDGRVQAQS